MVDLVNWFGQFTINCPTWLIRTIFDEFDGSGESREPDESDEIDKIGEISEFGGFFYQLGWFGQLGAFGWLIWWIEFNRPTIIDQIHQIGQIRA